MTRIISAAVFFIFFSLNAFSITVDHGLYNSGDAAHWACRQGNDYASCALGTGVYSRKEYQNIEDATQIQSPTYKASGVCPPSLPPGYSNVWCDDHFYYFSTCPTGTTVDSEGQCICPSGVPTASDGSCPTACQFASLDPGCAVDCPPIEYTYYQEGILRRGQIGGGQVGHGMTCPSPSYPSGSSQACIGSPGTCDTEGSYHESEDVVIIEETETTVDNGDGTSTTTTETEQRTIPGSSGGGGSSTGKGTTGKDDGGNTRTADCDQFPNDPACISDDQITIDGTTYQLCGHGGVVNASVGCDYTPPICSSGQIKTYYGCIDVPTAQPNDGQTQPGGSTTTTTNPSGGTTTTTTSGTSGSGTVTNNPSYTSTGNASADCSTPPSSSGDAQLDAILKQEWNLLCAGGEFSAPDMEGVATALEARTIEVQEELQDTIDGIKTAISDKFDINFAGGGSCSSNTKNIKGVSIDFSICRFIDAFSIVGTVFLALCAFLSFRIVLTR